MVLHNLQEELRKLDKTSPQFHEQLSDLLRAKVYRDAVQNLQVEDSTRLIEDLSSALAGISDSTSVPLRELGRLCGIGRVLPESCTFRIRRFNMCLKGNQGKAMETLYQAVVVWKNLVHPNIVPFLGITVDPPHLISNRMSGGDLTQYLTSHPETARRVLLFDVAKGLEYLHACNVIHGGLKGSNVLVDTTGHARITDFGLAMLTQNLDSMRRAPAEHGHGMRWIAPEILVDGGTYSKEGDVFSFAMVVIEAFTGAVPFSCEPPHTVMTAIVGGGRPPRPAHPTLTGGLWALTQWCWNQEAHLRPRMLVIVLNLKVPVWKELIDPALVTEERIPIITAIFSDPKETKEVGHLPEADAQAFVDAIDETLDALAPLLRKSCRKVLRKICGRRASLPSSLQIPPYYKRSGAQVHVGFYGELRKGEHQGRHIAVRVTQPKPRDFRPVANRICRAAIRWKALHHPNVMPLLGVAKSDDKLVMAWPWMENGNIMEYIKAHEGANRIELLGDVARGLAYLHDRGIVHEDLRGANILIDEHGHARLADFGLATVFFLCELTLSTPLRAIGWMSPECFDPDIVKPGKKDDRRTEEWKGQPTKESDCYSLGMVIFEVLTGGRAPFENLDSKGRNIYNVGTTRRIIRGERPGRPQGAEGAWFTDDIWEMLELCWSLQPKNRPTARAILERLERISMALEPLSPSQCGDTKTGTGGGLCSTTGDPAGVRPLVVVLCEWLWHRVWGKEGGENNVGGSREGQ